ncbi:MAG: hypothetical protein ACLGHT_08190 [Acidimicrobiia bacterium]
MRARLAMAAAALLVVGAPHSAADSGDAPPESLAVYEVRAEAGAVHTSVAVPAYFEAFHPYSLSEASNGSSHSYQTLGYPGFFLRAAGEQYGMPPAPGTTETLWPQGPKEGRAEAVPFEGAAMGETSATSFETGAKGQATSGGGALAGRRLGYGSTQTSVNAASAATAEARVSMRELDLGDGLVVGEVRGTATAQANGAPGGATASGNVELLDVRLHGVEVRMTAEGLRTSQTSIAFPKSGDSDAALARAGIEIRRLPDVTRVSDDGTASSVDIGGFEIRFTRPEREFTQTFTIGRLSVSTRAVRAGEQAPLEILSPPVVGGGEAAHVVATDPQAVSPPLTPRAGAAVSDEQPAARASTSQPLPGASWGFLSLLIALGVPLSLVFRRGLAAASTP